MVDGCRLRIQGLEMPAIQHVDIGDGVAPVVIPLIDYVDYIVGVQLERMYARVRSEIVADNLALHDDLAEDTALNPFLYYKVNA
jgi:hypothetical protein